MEGWAMYWKVSSGSDFPLPSYVIRGRLAVCFEVGGSVYDLGKVIFHWIVIHLALTGEAGQPLADSSLTHGMATSANQHPDKPLLEKN